MDHGAVLVLPVRPVTSCPERVLHRCSKLQERKDRTLFFYAKQNDFSRWFQRVFLILASDRVVDHFKSNNFCLTSPLSHPVRFLFSNSTPLLGTSSLPFLRSASLSQNLEPWKQLCRECPLPPQLRALPHPQPPFPPQPQPHPRPLPLPPL